VSEEWSGGTLSRNRANSEGQRTS